MGNTNGSVAGGRRRSRESEKILEYVRLVKEENDEEAFRQIVKLLNGYLQHLALKKFFFIAGNTSDDIYQEGLMALATKAIPDYNAEKGPFLGFAKLCIRRHIITVLKSSNNIKNRALNSAMSMDATVCNDKDDGPMSISNFLSSTDEEEGSAITRICRGEQNKAMKEGLLERLTGLEAKVLEYYLRNMSYVDIVQQMNRVRRSRPKVNTKTIDNALYRIKRKAIELEEQARRLGDESLFDDEEG